jgi:hypothetical protein
MSDPPPMPTTPDHPEPQPVKRIFALVAVYRFDGRLPPMRYAIDEGDRGSVERETQAQQAVEVDQGA